METLFLKMWDEIPENYRPACCETCKVRLAYAEGMDIHFGFMDCPYECDVEKWDGEYGIRTLKGQKTLL